MTGAHQERESWWDRYEDVPYLIMDGQHRTVDLTELAHGYVVQSVYGGGKTFATGALLSLKLRAERRRKEIKRQQRQLEIDRRLCLRLRRSDLVDSTPPPSVIVPGRGPTKVTVDLDRGDLSLPWRDDEWTREVPLDARLALEDAFQALVSEIAAAFLTQALCGRDYEFLDSVPPVASSPCGVLRLRSSHVPRAPGGSGHTSNLSATDALVG
ncbi:hypothetical protein ACNFRX_16930 [Streptomyces griseoaurantiacus]|uniref:hypothetical protein n=1 Tax=Streptomyces griseoaurantiacus TaxID=68213 RepID=UPI003F1CFDEE